METICSDDFLFEKTSNGDYVRKAFGVEATVCEMAMCDGFTHLTASAAAKMNGLQPAPTLRPLEPSVRTAWVAMRHQVPGIACRAFKASDGFAFRYIVPKSADEVDAWVKETVFLADSINSMRAVNRQLQAGHWWLPSDDRYVAELHISPSQDGWNISLSLSHITFDVRAAFSMLHLFLDFLSIELRGTTKLASSIEWGTETVRLQPPAPFIKSIVETGYPPKVAPPHKAVAETAETKPNGKEQSKPVVKPWLFVPESAGGNGISSRHITFSNETTEKLHAAAKKHGCTMTQLFTSLFILANTEAEFQTASSRCAKRFRELSGSFKEATHYLVAWIPINHRHKLPGGHDSFMSEVGCPTLAAHSESLVMPMDPIRSMFRLDESNRSVSRVVDAHAFWGGLVATVAAAWKAIDVSLDAYLNRSIALHSASQDFQPDALHTSALAVSSFGDLGRLGILNNYLPSKQSTISQTPMMVVTDVVAAVRCNFAGRIGSLYQYNGQLAARFDTSGEYTSEEMLDLAFKILKEWVDAVVSGF